MFKRPHLVGLGAAVALAMILLNLPGHTSSRLKFALSSLYLPLFGLASSAEKAGEAAGMRALPKGALIDQIEKLRQENDELRLEAMQHQETLREDIRLRRALDRLAADVKPISAELAEAREKLWTPDKETTEPEKKLWTPGSKEPA